MIVQAEAGQEGKIFHLPFVLEEGTGYLYFLLEIASITRHSVVHFVVLILQTCSERSWREKNLFEVTNIHSTSYKGKVIGLSESIRVLLSTIVAVTIDMLSRGKERKFMLIFFPKEIV